MPGLRAMAEHQMAQHQMLGAFLGRYTLIPSTVQKFGHGPLTSSPENNTRRQCTTCRNKRFDSIHDDDGRSVNMLAQPFSRSTHLRTMRSETFSDSDAAAMMNSLDSKTVSATFDFPL